MFTGIVMGFRPVVGIEDRDGFRRLTLRLGTDLTQGLERGASVAVSGTCLTAVEIGDEDVSFDVIAQSLRLTTLGNLEIGSQVNIERSARFGDEIGGHLLSGHVSGVARVHAIASPANNRVVTLSAPSDAMRFIFEKGFIGLDGCSLTVVNVDRDASTFEVHLIPETLERTTFGQREVGDLINLEVDPQTVAIVETVESVVRARAGELLGGNS